MVCYGCSRRLRFIYRSSITKKFSIFLTHKHTEWMPSGKSGQDEPGSEYMGIGIVVAGLTGSLRRVGSCSALHCCVVYFPWGYQSCLAARMRVFHSICYWCSVHWNSFQYNQISGIDARAELTQHCKARSLARRALNKYFANTIMCSITLWPHRSELEFQFESTVSIEWCGFQVSINPGRRVCPLVGKHHNAFFQNSRKC